MALDTICALRFSALRVLFVVLILCFFRKGLSCPKNCLCFRTQTGPTVRCNHHSLSRIPIVPSTTVDLDLRFNNISIIRDRDLAGLHQLTTLFLNGNSIHTIEPEAFSGLKSLKYLYLFNNKLKRIHENAFGSLINLEQLYLHSNEIEEIPVETFSDLYALERLYLHNNRLRSVPKGLFKNLPSLRRLRLDSNPLNCTCEILWLTRLLKETPNTENAATCGEPENLRGTSLVNLAPKDFNCTLPTFVKTPASIEVTVTDRQVLLSCLATGHPTPHITWWKDGNLLRQDQWHIISKEGTLKIIDPKIDDEGNYECVAQNSAGQIVSKAVLNYYGVEASPVLVRYPPSRVESIEGNSVSLKCRARGNPRPQIEWRREGLPLTSDPRFEIRPTGELFIRTVRVGDYGMYRCRATNSAGGVAASTRLVVTAPPRITLSPENTEVLEGSTAELQCQASGYPIPDIAWTKNGNRLPSRDRHILLPSGTLRVIYASTNDQGQYECRAINVVGVVLARAFLTVKPRVPPSIVESPTDIIVTAGQTVDIRCSAYGAPKPIITWIKNNVHITEANRYSVSPSGTLSIRDVGKADEGRYECAARNSIGAASAQMSLTVQVPLDEDRIGTDVVNSSLAEAKNNVETALNASIQQLFSSKKPRKPSDLLALFRFPSPAAREIARAAEIFERTIQLVHEHVKKMDKVNVTNAKYNFFHLLSPAHVNMIANLSGCSAHRRVNNCSDMCFHRKYRTFDGTCNNLQHPMWGASLTPFERLLSPMYDNGFNSPVGSQQTEGRPSARLVSTQLISSKNVSDDEKFTHMLMQWGQFVDHDIDFIVSSLSTLRFSDGRDCTKQYSTCDNQPPCFPIPVPENDHRIKGHRCMQFTRSSAVCGTGTTSLFFSSVTPREQMNQITSYIDGSNVYGSSEEEVLNLRDLDSKGLLKSNSSIGTGKPLLPFNRDSPIECDQADDSPTPCFLAGDFRANEQLGLLSMHTIWMREHNRIANELGELNPHWDDEKVYHEARKIVGAEMQHITYTEWLPKILGKRGMSLLGTYAGYEPNINAGIVNSFATAAFRFGHGLINPMIFRLNSSFQPIEQGNIPLHRAFFSPYRLVTEGGVDPILRGLFGRAAKSREDKHELLNSELTERLFEMAHEVALDLGALNIQRGRDHALPGYDSWRVLCNLSTAKTFDDFKDEIKDADIREKLLQLYKVPSNVDLWVAGLLEELLPGSLLGPTFTCIIAEQFRRLRAGDRFWYESPTTFDHSQLTQIKQTSLARVICDNGDSIDRIQPDVFLRATYPTGYVKCSSIPRMDLRMWKYCEAAHCAVDDRTPTFSNHLENPHLRRKVNEPHKSEAVESSREASKNIGLQEKNETVISPLEGKSEVTVNVPSKNESSLEKRVESLERTIADMAAKINSLGQAFSDLEKQANKMKEKSAKKGERSRKSCGVVQGSLRYEGDSWKQNYCTDCQCTAKGQIRCVQTGKCSYESQEEQ
ncbi:peroxidasin-like isoform X1 [Montipora foliosa]|uniref:peroxidasin-like isoform X1 n=1 Tax=Montipora foliosa TaxID=591990 RepID=UPI0035F156BF